MGECDNGHQKEMASHVGGLHTSWFKKLLSCFFLAFIRLTLIHSFIHLGTCKPTAAR